MHVSYIYTPPLAPSSSKSLGLQYFWIRSISSIEVRTFSKLVPLAQFWRALLQETLLDPHGLNPMLLWCIPTLYRHCTTFRYHSGRGVLYAWDDRRKLEWAFAWEAHGASMSVTKCNGLIWSKRSDQFQWWMPLLHFPTTLKKQENLHPKPFGPLRLTLVSCCNLRLQWLYPYTKP